MKILTAQPTAVICTAAHFRWDLEPQKEKKGTVQNQIFASMKKMEELKFKYRPFEGEADVWTEETYDTALLCVCRKSGNEMVTGLFNFSNEDRTAWIDMGEFTWKDLFTGEKTRSARCSGSSPRLRMVLPQMGLKSLAKERKV